MLRQFPDAASRILKPKRSEQALKRVGFWVLEMKYHKPKIEAERLHGKEQRGIWENDRAEQKTDRTGLEEG